MITRSRSRQSGVDQSRSRSCRNPGDFAAYLEQFPTGRYALLARSWLTNLRDERFWATRQGLRPGALRRSGGRQLTVRCGSKRRFGPGSPPAPRASTPASGPRFVRRFRRSPRFTFPVRKADWRSNRIKEREVRNAVRRALGGDDALTETIFEIVKAQHEY